MARRGGALRARPSPSGTPGGGLGRKTGPGGPARDLSVGQQSHVGPSGCFIAITIPGLVPGISPGPPSRHRAAGMAGSSPAMTWRGRAARPKMRVAAPRRAAQFENLDKDPVEPRAVGSAASRPPRVPWWGPGAEPWPSFTHTRLPAGHGPGAAESLSAAGRRQVRPVRTGLRCPFIVCSSILPSSAAAMPGSSSWPVRCLPGCRDSMRPTTSASARTPASCSPPACPGGSAPRCTIAIFRSSVTCWLL